MDDEQQPGGSGSAG